MAMTAAQRIVYVGETHTANEDHLLQLAVLKAMHAQGPVALGVEWFQAAAQPALDAFIAGDIDEAELLQRSEYYTRWHFDYRLYRPILLYAQREKIPLIALNVATELTREISQHGLNGLAADTRAKLPPDYDYSNTAYTAYLRGIFDQHARPHANFEHFLDVQLTWDEGMATAAAAYLASNPQHRMLVLAGRGHIEGRAGIPDRVTRRTGQRGTTVLSSTSPATSRSDADFVVFVQPNPLPPAGLLGAMLETDADGVRITGFAPGSVGEAGGLDENDIIRKLAGREIHHYADIKMALLDKGPGTVVEVQVERRGLFRERRHETFSIALGDEYGAGPHHRR